jgi:predicted dehydrogenase
MRVGIMSFAHLHAEGYIGLLRAMPNIEVVGFSDLDHARGLQMSQQYSSIRFPSHEALLEQDLDAVIVCTENATRREAVEMAARAGCHILCEKPIAVTLEDALAMRDAVTSAGVNFMTAFPMRFDPSIQILRERVQAGDLGRVYGVNGINHSEIPKAHRAWFADRELAGGGAVMDHTVHLTDLYRWIFNTEILEVYAEVSNPFYPDVDVDTAGIITLKLENGMFAGIDCSWSRPNTYPRWGHLKLEVVGERGSLEIDAFAQHLTVTSSKPVSRNPNWHGWGSDPNFAMLTEFFASIEEAREPSVTWKDGFEALRVALTCYESAGIGQPVRLENL